MVDSIIVDNLNTPDWDPNEGPATLRALHQQAFETFRTQAGWLTQIGGIGATANALLTAYAFNLQKSFPLYIACALTLVLVLRVRHSFIHMVPQVLVAARLEFQLGYVGDGPGATYLRSVAPELYQETVARLGESSSDDQFKKVRTVTTKLIPRWRTIRLLLAVLVLQATLAVLSIFLFARPF